MIVVFLSFDFGNESSITDFGSWLNMVELNLGTNQIQILPGK